MREQLAERNGLLLTVYQYMERVGGGVRPIPRFLFSAFISYRARTSTDGRRDLRPQRKSLSSSCAGTDPKPFTTDSKQFSQFHDRLLDRLKGVAQLQMSFERRAKELEGRFGEQFACVFLFLPLLLLPSLLFKGSSADPDRRGRAGSSRNARTYA